MNIQHGNGKTKYGPGVIVELTAEETRNAVLAYLTAMGVSVRGPRTITFEGKNASVYVDPSGTVNVENAMWTGRGGFSKDYLL